MVDFNDKLVIGLQCKACNKQLKLEDDYELCGVCMAVVDDLNKDLVKPDINDYYELED